VLIARKKLKHVKKLEQPRKNTKMPMKKHGQLRIKPKMPMKKPRQLLKTSRCL
jgi:hypothetical protein